MTTPPIQTNTEEEETYEDGELTKRKTTKSVKIDTADLAVVAVFLLCGVIFAMSIFIGSMREAVSGALPPLLGVFTLAVGGFALFTFLRKPDSSV